MASLLDGDPDEVLEDGLPVIVRACVEIEWQGLSYSLNYGVGACVLRMLFCDGLVSRVSSPYFEYAHMKLQSSCLPLAYS